MRKVLGQVVTLAGAISLLASCGGSSSGSGGGGGVSTGSPGFFIVIQGMAFSPSELAVPPGATVTVMNKDATLHSVTSASSPGDFNPGSVGGVQFDTGPFIGGQATFTVPANAANGTVVPYYCTVHKADMVPPNATIRVDNSAQPGPAPGSSGGGGGGGGGGGY